MNVLTFDTEGDLIAPGRAAPRMACLTWADSSGKAGLDNPDHGLDRMADALRDTNTFIVAANAPFDLGMLVQADPGRFMPLIFNALDDGRIGCTQVLSKLQYIAGEYPNQEHGLAPLVKYWLGKRVSGKNGGEDAWRLHYRKLIGVGVDSWPEAARSYAIEDAILARDVWMAQCDRPVPNLFPQMRAAWALHVMGAWGFRVDPDSVFALEQRIRPPVEAAIEKLKVIGLYRQVGTQNKKLLIEMITEAYKGRPPRGEPTDKMRKKAAEEGREAIGNVQYGADVLADSGHPDLELLASVGADMKELSAFLPMLLEAAHTGNPVCPSWNVLVNTGRTSCRKPNAQQLPKRAGVRECVVPRKGNLFFGADYSIAELKSLAQVLFNLWGHNSMQRAINAGKELHLITAARILQIPYDDAVRRYKSGDKEVKNARQLSKACNFGYPGGMGHEKFVESALSYGVTLTTERSKTLKQVWLDTYPEMRRYFDFISRQAAHGWFTLNQHSSGRIRAGCTYTSGCNTLFQGLTADGAKIAMYEITKRQLLDRSSALYGTRLNAFIHDEFLAEGPAGQVPEAADEMVELMLEGMRQVSPDVIHEADPYLMTRWTKGAKTVRDKNGRLCLGQEV